MLHDRHSATVFISLDLEITWKRYPSQIRRRIGVKRSRQLKIFQIYLQRFLRRIRNLLRINSRSCEMFKSFLTFCLDEHWSLAWKNEGKIRFEQRMNRLMFTDLWGSQWNFNIKNWLLCNFCFRIYLPTQFSVMPCSRYFLPWKLPT